MKEATDSLRRLHTSWGVNLREARSRFRWSQQALAALCNISSSGLSNIEAGRRAPSDEVKWKLAGALRTPVGDLFPWPDEAPPFPGLAVTEPSRTWSKADCGHRVFHLNNEAPGPCRQCELRNRRRAA